MAAAQGRFCMSKPFIKAAFALCCIVFIASCGQSAQGPGTWLDRPLHGMHFRIEPIILHAHASDANGISAIRFFVDGDMVSEVPLSGAQLEEAISQWTPPGAGIYSIHAEGIDALSRRGLSSSAVIAVWEEIPEDAGIGPEELPQVDTPTPTSSAAPPLAATDIPTPTHTPTPSKTPIPTNTSTPTTPPDTAGPEILVENFVPVLDMVGGSPSGCDDRRTGTHNLWLDDPSGIWFVYADWSVGGQSGRVFYTTTNDITFAGQYGPFTGTGTLSISGRAYDTIGNWTPFSFSKPVVSCIG
jgi:hypothetical protein